MYEVRTTSVCSPNLWRWHGVFDTYEEAVNFVVPADTCRWKVERVTP